MNTIVNNKQPVEHTVVIYDMVNSKGGVVSTHSTYNTEIPNVVIPEGLTLKVRPALPATAKVLKDTTLNYAAARGKEYPSVGDQLGAIWRILEQHPDLLGVEGREMLDRINSVKDTYVKDADYVLNTGGEGTDTYVPTTSN